MSSIPNSKTFSVSDLARRFSCGLLLTLSLWPTQAQGKTPETPSDESITAKCVLDRSPESQPQSSIETKPAIQITDKTGKVFFTVDAVSGPSELALAMHLKKVGAVMYSVFWCPHCHEQKQRFGVEALKALDIVECDAEGVSGQPDLCQQKFQAAELQLGKQAGFPTWEINGKFYLGNQTLEELAEASNYRGPQKFQHLVSEQ